MSFKPMDHYQQLYGHYSNAYQKNRKRLNGVAILRVITFLAAVYFGYQLISFHLWLGLAFVAVMLSIFIFLVIRYHNHKQSLALLGNLIRINANEIEALRGHFRNFEDGSDLADHRHAFATDLELFGEGSLYQYINRTSTYAGKNQLGHWLKNPLRREEDIKARQQAVHELKEMLTWRQTFIAIGYHLKPEQYQDTRLIAWSKERPSIGKNKTFRLFRWLLPLLTITVLVLLITGHLPLGYLLLVLAANLFVLHRVSKKVNTQHNRVTKQLATLRNYSLLFRHIENHHFQSAALHEFKGHFYSGKMAASKIIRKLSRISDALDNRISPVLGQLLNLVFLWDIHQAIRLEKWHGRYAAHIEEWIAVLGSFDAYISLASFAYNHEDFNFPQISNSTIFSSVSLGHPLIPENKRVANDLTINRKGAIMIITGANMAGKSTFLRTIGVNLVLAMAGSVVCARDMHFRITRLFTSMNIIDSLSRNESYFYAEIKRLKQLTDHVMNTEHLFVLLDEILTGTNTRDKEKASKAFLKRLVEMQVTSVIATHDLSLTTLEEDYPRAIRNASFEVELEHGQMRYDYKLRQGVARNMNALDLLRDMGLI